MSPISNENKNNTTNNDEPLQVLIIGAGWAGLAAAKELRSKGVDRVQILEGRDTFGGRCRSLDNGVQLGAQWIHGARKSNPIYKAALDADLELKRTSYASQAIYDQDGSRVPEEKYRQMYSTLMEGKEGFYAYQEHRQDHDDKDVSLRQCANDYLDKMGATQEQRHWMDYLLDMEIVQEYSGSVEDTSMFWWDSDEDIPGGDVEIQSGYRGILEHYVKGIEHLLEYNAKVTQIDWKNENEGVTVHYTQHGQAKQVTAQRVVVTVPIGVLQAQTIAFQPALPRAKQRCIDNIGMGLLNKCVFVWDDSTETDLPWKDHEWIERIAPASQGLWTEFYNPQAVTGQPLLVAFTAGRVAVEVEQWTDQEIQEAALAALRQQFGSSVPTPKQVIVTKWGQDEWSYGSYSFNKIGGKHSDRKKLAEPLEGRLYFAGEACHAQYFGTTQGALMSGLTAAKQIVGQQKKSQAAKKKAATNTTSATAATVVV